MPESFIIFVVRTYGVAIFIIFILILLFWCINHFQQKRAVARERARKRNLRYAVRWEAYDRAVEQIKKREARLRDDRIFDTVRDFNATK